ncbi:MAG: signal peptidase II [Clostridia bacterium]|nr:signal peptidase II [Clostridia bacterium]
MQRTRTARRKRLVSLIVSLSLLVLLVVFDQFSKNYFEKLYRSNGNTSVIDGFFSFTYVVNKGAAWSFLADKSWGQTFFKILTIIALVLFVFFYIVSYKKCYRFLLYGISVACAGTIGNFIDRLFYGGVTDFISFQFGSYNFPVFNLADICLTVGVIIIIVHLLFLDENSVFGSNGKRD